VDLRLTPENKAKLERIARAKRRTITSIIDEIIETLDEPEESRK
jgi:predicted DNA-binding protein